MEKKIALHTEQVSGKNKTYYLDLKQAANNNNFLVITQSTKVEEGKQERVKMILFEKELEQFSQALAKMTLQFAKKNDTPAKKETFVTNTRKAFPSAFRRWTAEEAQSLKELYLQGHNVPELMAHFQRSEKGITSRLEKMGVEISTSTAPAA